MVLWANCAHRFITRLSFFFFFNRYYFCSPRRCIYTEGRRTSRKKTATSGKKILTVISGGPASEPEEREMMIKKSKISIFLVRSCLTNGEVIPFHLEGPSLPKTRLNFAKVGILVIFLKKMFDSWGFFISSSLLDLRSQASSQAENWGACLEPPYLYFTSTEIFGDSVSFRSKIRLEIFDEFFSFPWFLRVFSQSRIGLQYFGTLWRWYHGCTMDLLWKR